MALRNGSYRDTGMIDIAMNIAAFEMVNGVRIVLTMTVGDSGDRAGIWIGAVARESNPEGPEAKVLASVSVNCLATRLRTLDAAIIHALYMLDGEFARRALSKD